MAALGSGMGGGAALFLLRRRRRDELHIPVEAKITRMAWGEHQRAARPWRMCVLYNRMCVLILPVVPV